MRVADSDRERMAQLLYEAMGAGRLTTAEVESRLDLVYAAKTFADFEPIIADLPAASPARPVHPDDGVPGPRGSVAVMSGVARRFDGVLPAEHVSRAFWGSVRLDLRHAEFPDGLCTIKARAVMGGIRIVVPEDVVVDVRGVGLMGGFGGGRRPGGQRSTVGAPVLRVTGFAWWGSVKVVRKSRESPRKSRREHRSSRRARR
ncbi:hypothetical protein AVL48_20240 [Amycolatopsis regifaucium]|uniref:DUF1707 domain-containing protein n=2 Tax=Amycolatopsis regifaucium TaxID=546365 RepID=A0A154MXG1_9PSEU|nr:hypothetical protein AVL48_20240 [Amycolatopsis regifaucium]OKA11518.1 hypothetical protein ATP06_0200630 [Amycolatopsis regifaucium]SFH42865.1 Cell wall-active antibiotics response 4TMS YvqF [Amycolatopsis regifaucium]